jgi:DNA-binding HxlR family transcriptional regulator
VRRGHLLQWEGCRYTRGQPAGVEERGQLGQLVLTALAGTPQRYSELSRTIAGVSQKMLTQTLRMLERDGLVTRTITPSVPVRVDYQLTPLGHTLLPVVRAIKDWSETHIAEVQAARAAYGPSTRLTSA